MKAFDPPRHSWRGGETSALSLRTRLASVAAVSAVLLLAAPAHAQQATVEDRLREALRKVTADLRALQDAQAGRQAELEEAKKQKELLQQQADLQAARIAALEPRASAVEQLQAQVGQCAHDFTAVQANNQTLLETLQKWQQAYNEVADVARAKDADTRKAAAGLATVRQTLGVCQEKNDKLGAVARDTLDLYGSDWFSSLAWKSREPVLGLWKVKLENIMQDYQDRVLDEQFDASAPVPVGRPESASATPAPTAPAAPPSAQAPGTEAELPAADPAGAAAAPAGDR